MKNQKNKMGYNLNNDVPLGQLGSGFIDSTSTVTPPTGMVIIAVTFLSDLKFNASGGLVPELPTDDTFKGPTFDDSGTTRAQINSFGTVAQTIKNGLESVPVDGDNLFPKGMTIYGRWTSFKLSAGDSTGGAILYYGY